jgi:hypothetical protein
VGKDADSDDRDYPGGLSRDKREAIIEAAADHAAARARKEMTAILTVKEVARRSLSRSDVRVDVNLPTLGARRSSEPPWIGDWNAGDDFVIIDDDPTDAVIAGGPNGPIWWMDMTDPTDPT